jgi:membrane protein involved in colicin uptake
MEPGTAAILTLSAITGISGYGAMKLNAKAKAGIDELIKAATEDAKALIASARKAKLDAERERNKKQEEIERLKSDIIKMETAKQQLLDEKVVLTKKLESATELEKTYRELSPEVFKQSIMDFKSNKRIEKLGHPEFFDPLLSRFSVNRGTAQSLYTKFKNAVTVMMLKEDFDLLLLRALKNGKSSLEKRQKKEAEEAQAAKTKAEAEAKTKAEAKAKAAAEVQALRQAEAEAAAAKKKADQETALKNARERVAARDAAIEKAAKERAAAEAFVKKTAADAKIAKEKAAQEKGALTLRKPTGGMRKKKLRTRRGVKQNVRRTRRSQNRPNRTDTYSSRRTEVDASGDELGL